MVCNKCNSQVQEGSQFCPNCGNDMTSPTVENTVVNDVNNQGNINPEQNLGNVPGGQVQNTQDKVNIWLVILSWFIPLAGLIIFFVQKKTSPKTAKASGICALISALLSIVVVVILCFSLIFGSLNYAIESTDDTAQEIIEQAESQIKDAQDMLDDNLNTNTEKDESITSDSSTTTNVNVSNDWKQYQFGINGKVYTLPMSYNDFKIASGFTIKDTYLNMVLPNNHYAPVNLYKNDKLALYIELFNKSGAEAKYVESNVTRISQTKYQVSQGADKIIFPGGLKVGDSITEAKLTELFGVPNDSKDYSGNKQYTYLSDTTWTTTNNFKINVKDGVIDEIQLDHRG